MKLLRDLFTGISGGHWELARFLAAYAVVSYSATFIVPLWRLINSQGEPPTFDYSALGLGYAAVLAGAGALIWAKDTAKTAAVTAANPPAVPSKVEVINTPANPVPTTEGEAP